MIAIKRLLNSQSKTITSAAFLIGGAGLASRILGLIRDRILAGLFGAGDDLDIYYAAFRIPDLVYSLLIMGALSSAFIPVFTLYLVRNKKEAWRLVNGVFNLGLLILVVLAGILILLAPWVIPLIAPGFGVEKRASTVALAQIMFLSPILLGMSTIFGDILQTFKRFFIYSLAPIFYNIGIICGALFLTPIWGIAGLAWGVVLGALLHLLVQAPSAIYSGFRYQWVLDLCHPGIRKIGRLMIPRTLGLAAFQINLIVITAIASKLVSGSVAVFNLSSNLQYVPVGIFGIAFATAAFPALSHAFSRGRKREFLDNFSSTFSQILFLVIPAGILFFLLRAQIVRLVLGTGKFGWIDTRLTAACLGLFSLSIFAQGLIPLVSKAFYAFHNTKIPVIISVVSMLINILGSLFLVFYLIPQTPFRCFLINFLKLEGIEEIAIIGLPLAFSFASIVNLGLLVWALYGKIGDFGIGKIANTLGKVLSASFLMGVACYGTLYLVAPFVAMDTFFGVFIQALSAGLVGVVVYLGMGWILRCEEIKMIGRVFRQHKE